MAEDREVLREIWEGKLPICFTLCADEVHTPTTPDPYYLMVPRLSYFPLVTDKVRRYFARYIHPDKQDAELWLEFEGQPLKWHYPIGVLYDNTTSCGKSLPWKLEVHFDKFPEQKLMHCPSREAVESHFMSCLKEADALKHRGVIVSGMQKKDHTQLWTGLQNDKFDQFWAINRKIMECSEGFRYIPFRCYHFSLGERPFLQSLMKPIQEGSSKTTLTHLVQQCFPDWNVNEVSIMTHGIRIPLETPLQWLSEHLSYPDNFLHLTVQL
nr:EOG090X0BB3 [Triops cancriformis]